MVFDVKDFDVRLKKPRRELDEETRTAYRQHYLDVFCHLGIKVESDNEIALSAAADYFGRWWAGEKQEADFPERGLFLFGGKGTGKTSIMQRFSALFGIEFISVWDLSIVFSKGRNDGFWDEVQRFDHSHLIVDDLGNEMDVKSFGNEMPIPDLIRYRETLFQHHERRFTFFTSNFQNRAAVTNAYGDTVFSRIAGMCDFVEFTGKDHRLVRS